jgi:hypothetical protein
MASRTVWIGHSPHGRARQRLIILGSSGAQLGGYVGVTDPTSLMWVSRYADAHAANAWTSLSASERLEFDSRSTFSGWVHFDDRLRRRPEVVVGRQ